MWASKNSGLNFDPQPKRERSVIKSIRCCKCGRASRLYGNKRTCFHQRCFHEQCDNCMIIDNSKENLECASSDDDTETDIYRPEPHMGPSTEGKYSETDVVMQESNSSQQGYKPYQLQEMVWLRCRRCDAQHTINREQIPETVCSECGEPLTNAVETQSSLDQEIVVDYMVCCRCGGFTAVCDMWARRDLPMGRCGCGHQECKSCKVVEMVE